MTIWRLLLTNFLFFWPVFVSVRSEYVRTLAGSGLPGYQEGPAVTAQFNNTRGLSLHPDGKSLYIADTGNNVIRRLILSEDEDGTLNGTVEVVAGQPGYYDNFYKNGVGTNARFVYPHGLSIHPNGEYALVGTAANVLRNLTFSTGMVGHCYSAVGSPWAAMDPSNHVAYVSSTDESRIMGMSSAASWIIAGSPRLDTGLRDGEGTYALFRNPTSIILDPVTQDLFVADQGNHCIRRVSKTGSVTTWVGSGVAGYLDGIGTSAQLSSPESIALDAERRVLYISDTGNFVIRAMGLDTGQVYLVAGTPSVQGREDGLPYASSFQRPSGVAWDPVRRVLYVSDSEANCIRIVEPGTPPPLFTPSPTPSPEVIATPSPVPPTATATASPSASSTPTFEVTLTASPSPVDPSPSASPSASPLDTPSPTPTFELTQTPSADPSAASASAPDPSPSASPSGNVSVVLGLDVDFTLPFTTDRLTLLPALANTGGHNLTFVWTLPTRCGSLNGLHTDAASLTLLGPVVSDFDVTLDVYSADVLVASDSIHILARPDRFGNEAAVVATALLVVVAVGACVRCCLQVSSSRPKRHQGGIVLLLTALDHIQLVAYLFHSHAPLPSSFFLLSAGLQWSLAYLSPLRDVSMWCGLPQGMKLRPWEVLLDALFIYVVLTLVHLLISLLLRLSERFNGPHKLAFPQLQLLFVHVLYAAVALASCEVLASLRSPSSLLWHDYAQLLLVLLVVAYPLVVFTLLHIRIARQRVVYFSDADDVWKLNPDLDVAQLDTSRSSSPLSTWTSREAPRLQPLPGRPLEVYGQPPPSPPLRPRPDGPVFAHTWTSEPEPVLEVRMLPPGSSKPSSLSGSPPATPRSASGRGVQQYHRSSWNWQPDREMSSSFKYLPPPLPSPSSKRLKPSASSSGPRLELHDFSPLASFQQDEPSLLQQPPPATQASAQPSATPSEPPRAPPHTEPQAGSSAAASRDSARHTEPRSLQTASFSDDKTRLVASDLFSDEQDDELSDASALVPSPFRYFFILEELYVPFRSSLSSYQYLPLELLFKFVRAVCLGSLVPADGHTGQVVQLAVFVGTLLVRLVFLAVSLPFASRLATVALFLSTIAECFVVLVLMAPVIQYSAYRYVPFESTGRLLCALVALTCLLFALFHLFILVFAVKRRADDNSVRSSNKRKH